MEYKISVIVPVYNAEQYLKAAMDSLLTQTLGFDCLQIICVDDCSTDASHELIAEYAQKYTNVHVYKTEVNSGAAGIPRNIGLDQVSAPYVMFLDPDDFFDREACRILYEKITSSDVEMVGGCYSVVNEQGENPLTIYPCSREMYCVCPDQAIEVMKVMTGCWCHIIKKEFLCKHGIKFTTQGYGQDTAFLCKCIAKNCRYVYLPNSLVYYRQNSNSVTHKVSEEYFQKNLPSVSEVKESFEHYPEACLFKLSKLGEGYFYRSVWAENLDGEMLKRIYSNYRELFVEAEKYNLDEPLIGLYLINASQYGMAAKYALIIRDYLNRIGEKERVIHQMEIGINEKNDVIRQKETEINEKNDVIRQKETEINEKNDIICQKETEINEKNDVIRQKETEINEKDDIIQRINQRFIIRLIDAIHQKQFVEAIKICIARLKRYINT